MSWDASSRQLQLKYRLDKSDCSDLRFNSVVKQQAALKPSSGATRLPARLRLEKKRTEKWEKTADPQRKLSLQH